MPREAPDSPARPLAAAPPLTIGHGSAGLHVGLAASPPLELVELEATIEPGGKDQPAKALDFDGTAPDLWGDAQRCLPAVCDPQQGLYLAGERHLAYFHAGAGQHIPLPGVQFHLGKAGETIAPGGAGAVRVWRLESGTPGDSGYEVAARDWLGEGIADGTPCYVFQHLQSKAWFAVPRPATRAAARFGLCQSNWSYVGHYPSHPDFNPATDFALVTVKECADALGGGAAGPNRTVVLLPNAKGDPNLVAGDVISFVDTPDGSLVCVSEYMDDPIGTVKMFDAPNVPLRPGWECMSEMAEGGGRFPLGTCSDGQMQETGGSASHQHTGATAVAGSHNHGASTGLAGAHNHGGVTGEGGEHDHDSFTGNATTDITIAAHATADVAGCIANHTSAQICAVIQDHGPHSHGLPLEFRAADGVPQVLIYDDDALTTTDFDDPPEETGPTYEHRKHKPSASFPNDRVVHAAVPDPSGELSLLHAITEPAGGTGHKHTIPQHYGHTHTIPQQGNHSHSVTSDGEHTHSFTTSAAHLNPYYAIKFIRRIDNAA